MRNSSTVIVDYGVGNVGALLNMHEHLGLDCLASSKPDALLGARRLILPGVGAFDRAMSSLKRLGLVEVLNEVVHSRGIPVLGVCLGMQILGRRSEEGQEPGLGWVGAEAVRISPPAGSTLKVPHIGWANVEPLNDSPLFRSVARRPERFYFVHSYHMKCDSGRDVAASFDYGGELCCAISRGNVHGVQFHPEKSHAFGMRLLSAFSGL